MRYILIYLLLCTTGQLYAQSDFPFYLQGTWKVENQELYEHWDSLNDNTLKGYSYQLKDGQMKVSEYLDLIRSKNTITYTATVVRQNGGKPVSFKLARGGTALTFENPAHDFPKKVVYQKLTDAEIQVEISDGKSKAETFRMYKQQVGNATHDTGMANPAYDEALAQKLGADEYGMKRYVLVILKTGPTPPSDNNLVKESFRGHMENINRLVKEGKLIVAGPLGKNDRSYRGIFILKDVASLDEAKVLLQTDPAVKAGILDAEVYNWYGSAALPEYLPFSDKIWKAKP